ncbi:MAG: sel1 repeat family protein [Bacilli bacterium]|nr:sel1 repeat family protein [Bacilli bacterium]
MKIKYTCPFCKTVLHTTVLELPLVCPTCSKPVKVREEDLYFLVEMGKRLFHDNDLRELALEYFLDASACGASEVDIYLGALYFEGVGTEPDEEKAFSYLLSAYERKDPDAMYYLGRYYLGKDENEKAVSYFEEAAEYDHPHSIGNLAACYATGVGVKKDPKKAFGLYSRAAELGNPDSMALLGGYYERGEVTEVDKWQALYWYKRSLDSGNEMARILYYPLYHELHPEGDNGDDGAL